MRFGDGSSDRGWANTADSLLVVTVKSTKYLKSSDGITSLNSEDCPYVVFKFGSFEQETLPSKAVIENSEIKQWNWNDDNSKSNTFICPFQANTHLSLIVMNQKDGKHAAAGHVKTNFPQTLPPKMDKTIKFHRRLLPVTPGTRDHAELKNISKLYRRSLKLQPSDKNVVAPAAATPASPELPASTSSQSAPLGKVSFYVTIVSDRFVDQWQAEKAAAGIAMGRSISSKAAPDRRMLAELVSATLPTCALEDRATLVSAKQLQPLREVGDDSLQPSCGYVVGEQVTALRATATLPEEAEQGGASSAPAEIVSVSKDGSGSYGIILQRRCRRVMMFAPGLGYADPHEVLRDQHPWFQPPVVVPATTCGSTQMIGVANWKSAPQSLKRFVFPTMSAASDRRMLLWRMPRMIEGAKLDVQSVDVLGVIRVPSFSAAAKVAITSQAGEHEVEIMLEEPTAEDLHHMRLAQSCSKFVKGGKVRMQLRQFSLSELSAKLATRVDSVADKLATPKSSRQRKSRSSSKPRGRRARSLTSRSIASDSGDSTTSQRRQRTSSRGNLKDIDVSESLVSETRELPLEEQMGGKDTAVETESAAEMIKRLQGELLEAQTTIECLRSTLESIGTIQPDAPGCTKSQFVAPVDSTTIKRKQPKTSSGWCCR